MSFPVERNREVVADTDRDILEPKRRLSDEENDVKIVRWQVCAYRQNTFSVCSEGGIPTAWLELAGGRPFLEKGAPGPRTGFGLSKLLLDLHGHTFEEGRGNTPQNYIGSRCERVR